MIHQWALKWGVHMAAVQDLIRSFGMESTEPATSTPGVSETAIQNAVRLEAARKGARIWRNNVGAMMDDSGRWVRYGLCNDSKAMSKRIKSSDRVGIRSVRVTPEMVGGLIGQFIAREVKVAGWHYTGTEREEAQLRFLQIVNSLGGDGQFCTGEGTL